MSRVVLARVYDDRVSSGKRANRRPGMAMNRVFLQIRNAPFVVLSFCIISTNALPILNEEASGNLVEHLELGLTNKNSAPGRLRC